MGATLDKLDIDPHPLLARMRAASPACWVLEAGGWLVTGHAAATEVLLDTASFTVDDPRFTTARVSGASMLSLDGAEHARHRAAFARAFRPGQAERRLGDFTRAEAARLSAAIWPHGQAELRTQFAGPLAAAVMTQALGLASAGITPGTVLAWYRDIVAAVAELPAGAPPLAEQPPAGQPAAGPSAGSAPAVTVASFAELAAGVRAAIASGRAPLLADAARAGGLSPVEVTSNAAVVLFGGIETTEGMICNAVLQMLRQPLPAGGGQDPGLIPALVEESLRFEPAAAVVDRYATRDVTLAGTGIRAGDLVRVSITGANRDPAVFAEPDRFDIGRRDAARHLAFARGPHYCLGAHLARLEAVTALTALLAGLPGLRLDPDHRPEVRGLVFRKPAELRVRWG
jgi:cytochrome P450